MTQAFQMIALPAERSAVKPRTKGLTMMMDWGLPIGRQEDLLGLIAPHVDLAKLVVGTARLYEESYLRQKLECYERHQISPFIGGQFLEYVYATDGIKGVGPFCEEARRLGIKAVEVSDNVVTLDADDRHQLIRCAVDCGLEVHGEVGSKSQATSAAVLIEQAERDFESGVSVVLVEGAELIQNDEPNLKLINDLKSGLDVDRVIFELSGTWIPGTLSTNIYALKGLLVETFGPDVNLANILPDDIWETEALRVGLSVPGPPTP